MASFDDVPEAARKAFEEHKKAQEEEMQEFFACFTKACRGSITQIKEPILPPIDSKREVCTTQVSDPSTSVTPEDVTDMLNDHTKHLTNHLHYMLESSLEKIIKTLSPSSNSGSVPSISQALSSSARHETLENPPYGMPKNFTPTQTPPVMNIFPSRPETAMVVNPRIIEPLNSMPSSATVSSTNE
jgi:hypothetical protein